MPEQFEKNIMQNVFVLDALRSGDPDAMIVVLSNFEARIAELEDNSVHLAKDKPEPHSDNMPIDLARHKLKTAMDYP